MFGSFSAHHLQKNGSGKDGILFPIQIDCSKSKIRILDDAESMSLQDVVETDDNSLKDVLRKKWKEVNGA